MRIQLASDFHLEFERPRSPARIIEPAPDADVLVLAGDIHKGTEAVDAFPDWPVPVVLVAGNHEFYGRDWLRTRDELQRAAAGKQTQGEPPLMRCVLPISRISSTILRRRWATSRRPSSRPTTIDDALVRPRLSDLNQLASAETGAVQLQGLP